jgi:tellurite resistance protein TerC
MDALSQHPGLLTAFGVGIALLLALDLGLFNRRSHAISNRQALIWTGVWVGFAMGFSALIYQTMGAESFAQFQSAYWIEKALSVDNLFVFILVFNYFNVTESLQHKVLFYGILGAILLRAVFIFSGVELIRLTYLPAIEWGGKSYEINLLLTIFGAVLIVAGWKAWFAKTEDDGEKDFAKSPGARVIHAFFRVSEHYDGDKFFTRENGIRIATPLLVVVAVVEFTDLLFAIDSIPAIFAIAPNDPFILYTSNIFAILGLRSLYFLLANSQDRFSKLKYGLALILAFIGCKMVLAPVFHVPTPVSLAVVGGVLVVSVVASLLTARAPGPTRAD